MMFLSRTKNKEEQIIDFASQGMISHTYIYIYSFFSYYNYTISYGITKHQISYGSNPISIDFPSSKAPFCGFPSRPFSALLGPTFSTSKVAFSVGLLIAFPYALFEVHDAYEKQHGTVEIGDENGEKWWIYPLVMSK